MRHKENSVKVVRVYFSLLCLEKATKREKFRFSAGKNNNGDAKDAEDGVLNKINSIRIC